jgi:hypothetical protein
MYFLELGLWDVLGLVPVQVFMALLFLNRFSGFFAEVRDKKRTALLSAGIVVALIGIVLNPVFSFDGLVGLGEGESFTEYGRSNKGLLGEMPELSITVEKIEGMPLDLGKDSAVELRTGENEVITLRPGQSDRLSSVSVVRVLDVGAAPRYIIRKNSGDLLVSGSAMLKLYPKGHQDYFLADILPHRFYLSISGSEDKALHLKILRGKLVLADKDIAEEQVVFDDLTISFPEIDKWVVLQVQHRPGMWIIYLGLAVALLGGLFEVASKRGK